MNCRDLIKYCARASVRLLFCHVNSADAVFASDVAVNAVAEGRGNCCGIINGDSNRRAVIADDELNVNACDASVRA